MTIYWQEARQTSLKKMTEQKRVGLAHVDYETHEGIPKQSAY